ncbi:DMT family transporter [Silicimonas sp. MF1-12-2]|uniref:DMT family transporter n=1 Tax=Silicimonas sp. MF1-12-2 TaxID=3384793 RepID=UPI0039B36AA4
MSSDRPVLGIALMLGFCIVAPMADALAKLLGANMGVAQLVAIRMGLQVVLLLPLVWWMRLSLRMPHRVLRLTVIRAVLHMAGIGMMFLSLRYLPLADAIAIAFVMPFIMLVLGYFVLGEEVGHRRIMACCVGFIGTLMVMQPSFAEVGWPAVLPLGVAVIFSLFMLVTRQIAKRTDPIALQVVSGVIASAILVPVLLLSEPLAILGLGLAMPSGGEWLLLFIMGALGTGGHLLMTWSLRYAPSTTLAPMQYLEIPVATLLGWLIFSDFPDGLALAGIAVTISAGLYIIHREQSVSRSMRQAPRQAPPAA